MIEIEETSFRDLYNIKVNTSLGSTEFLATFSELVNIWKELGNIVLVETLKERIYSDNMKVSTRWDREKLVMQLIIERNSKKKQIELELDEIPVVAALLSVISDRVEGVLG
mgnify:CR=1 FL=1